MITNALNVDLRKFFIIRYFEETLLYLFSKGLINGTTHTYCGQEPIAIAISRYITARDTVISNHRCHGHYLALTDNTTLLLREILGRSDGLNQGLGGSQHLFDRNNNFYTNGIQGAFMPTAFGIAMAEKQMGTRNICLIFTGDGTWGEGVVYETLNLAGLYQSPLLIIIEDNGISQTTPSFKNLSGTFCDRAKAFKIKYFESSSYSYSQLCADVESSISYVRETSLPAIHRIKTLRLNSHSKGDDTRSTEELDLIRLEDPANEFFSFLDKKIISNIESEIFERISSEIIQVIPELNIAELASAIRLIR